MFLSRTFRIPCHRAVTRPVFSFRSGIILLCLIFFPCHVRCESFQSHQIKAVFLCNLTNFVTWPEGTFESPTTPISICILGEDPFKGYLDRVVRDETVNGRGLVVHRIAEIRDMRSCQILFVSLSMQDQLPKILAASKKYKLLTVGEMDGFAVQGGMVNLIPGDGRMRLRINLAAARKAGLQLSSKLLNLATIVNQGESD